MINSLAPIVIFTYRRLINKTIESLLNNELAKDSELYIFSDGNKNKNDLEDVIEVRKYLQTIKGFKNIKIIESEKNKGLAHSIIDGVTQIIDKYGKVIVLEDDLIVSNDFIEYMNESLNFYKNDENIWTISGYGASLPCLDSYEHDLYLSPRGWSWGWATWEDRWDSIDWDVTEFKTLKNNRVMKDQFEIGGNDMYKMLELQVLGKIDSWYIRSAFSQFLQNKYTVYPVKSKILNNGFSDSKGTHNSGDSTKWDTSLNNKSVKFECLQVDSKIVNCFKRYHDLSLFTKIGYLLKKYGGHQLGKKIYKLIQ